MFCRLTGDALRVDHRAWLALHDACAKLLAEGKIPANPLRDDVAAISVGIYKDEAVLDLDYPEDSDCDTDMNVVMTGRGCIVELQKTAEGEPFTRVQMDLLVDLAEAGINELVARQKAVLISPEFV